MPRVFENDRGRHFGRVPEMSQGHTEEKRPAQLVPSGETVRDARGAGPRRHAVWWLTWLFGAALLAAVIFAAVHYSEERAFVVLLRRVEPWWLGLAAAFQLATYFAEGEVWRVVTRSAGVRVPIGMTYKLSVAKLFIDQFIPSGGISGTLVFARALEQRGIARSVVMAAVVVGTVSYHGAYVVSLAVAVFILALEGRATRLIVVTSALFSVVAIALLVIAMALSGRKTTGLLGRISRVPLIRDAVGLVQDADAHLVRTPRLLLFTSLYQLAIVALDASTMWFLIRSLDARASPVGVYASFMISSLFRTVGVIPGGLGTFEAASVLTLRMANISLAVALAATLLFRGLSFWLPLIPGLVFSRRAMRNLAPRR